MGFYRILEMKLEMDEIKQEMCKCEQRKRK